MLYKQIDIPCSPLTEVPQAPSYQNWYWYKRYPVSRFSFPFKTWLNSKGLIYTRLNCILFYAHPNSDTSIHTDQVVEFSWAMNIVLGDAPISMSWYETAGAGTHQQDSLNYNIHDPQTSTLIDSCTLKSTIVRIDIPHKSENKSEVGSWVLSIRQYPMKIDWNGICDLF